MRGNGRLTTKTPRGDFDAVLTIPLAEGSATARFVYVASDEDIAQFT